MEVEPVWHIKDPEIGSVMSSLRSGKSVVKHTIDMSSAGVEKQANCFDWDNDFYDIDRDKKIIWSDANSIKTAATILQTEFGGGKDEFVPADSRVHIRWLVDQHKQKGCDLIARMPDGYLNGNKLKISLKGYSELVARKTLANDPRVSNSPEPWFPFNREIEASLDAKRKGIAYALKNPKNHKIDAKKCKIPVELLTWVKPSDLAVAYTIKEHNLAPLEKWPEDAVQAILHAHLHGYYVLGSKQCEQETR